MDNVTILRKVVTDTTIVSLVSEKHGHDDRALNHIRLRTGYGTVKTAP